MISIEQLKKKSYFNMGSNEYYEGYYIESERWNGWARPYFEKDIADLIAHNFSTSDYKIVYNKEHNYYSIIYKEGAVTVEVLAKQSIINTIEGQKEVYDFGSVAWTWDDFTIDELSQKANANIITSKSVEKDNSINMEY